MPFKAQGDNVPFLGPRSRYSLVGADPGWCYHVMKDGFSLGGAAPVAEGKNANTTDPAIVKGGYSEYNNLTAGGLFTIIAHYKLPIIVEAADIPSGATASLVGSDGAKIRDWPTSYPFQMSPGECPKFTGGSAGAKVGLLMRIADTVVW